MVKPRRRYRRKSHKAEQGVRNLEMSVTEKRRYLRQLPRHRNTRNTEGKRYQDIGTLRPWDSSSIYFLVDELRAGAGVTDIAFMARRDPDDVYAMVAITKFVLTQLPDPDDDSFLRSFMDFRYRMKLKGVKVQW